MIDNIVNGLVSCIITTYKRPKNVVKRAVLSVLNQTYSNIEIIVVDDSPSTYQYRDQVKSEIMSLSNKIMYISHSHNKGACAARNTGIDQAKGQYIAFLDDDDEWLPNKIEKQIKKMSDNVALVYCGYCIMDEKSNIRKNGITKYFKGNIYDKLLVRNYIGSTSFPLLSKKAVCDVGKFDINMPAAQDCDLWLRIAKKYRIDYIEEPLVIYYVHDGEQISKSNKKKIEALEMIEKKHLDYLRSHPKVYSESLIVKACYLMKTDKRAARNMFLFAQKIYPFNIKRNIRFLLSSFGISI